VAPKKEARSGFPSPLKSPMKTGLESPGRAMGLPTGKIAGELCALADLQLKRTIRAIERPAVQKAFLTKAKVFRRGVPNSCISLLVRGKCAREIQQKATKLLTWRNRKARHGEACRKASLQHYQPKDRFLKRLIRAIGAHIAANMQIATLLDEKARRLIHLLTFSKLRPNNLFDGSNDCLGRSTSALP
jgi:hypothetical protein